MPRAAKDTSSVLVLGDESAVTPAIRPDPITATTTILPPDVLVAPDGLPLTSLAGDAPDGLPLTSLTDDTPVSLALDAPLLTPPPDAVEASVPPEEPTMPETTPYDALSAKEKAAQTPKDLAEANRGAVAPRPYAEHNESPRGDETSERGLETRGPDALGILSPNGPGAARIPVEGETPVYDGYGRTFAEGESTALVTFAGGKSRYMGDNIDQIHPDSQRTYHFTAGHPTRVHADDAPFFLEHDTLAFTKAEE